MMSFEIKEWFNAKELEGCLVYQSWRLTLPGKLWRKIG